MGSSQQLTKGAVIAREFAGRTSAVELDAADTAHLVLGHVPVPGGNGIPFLQSDLHCLNCKKEKCVTNSFVEK
jgi:hypothetical protein